MKFLRYYLFFALSLILYSCDTGGGNPDIEYFGINRIYSINTNGSGRKLVSTGGDFSLLPNGKILYLNEHKLHLVDPDGNNEIIISPDDIEIFNYRLYLDGTKILFNQYIFQNPTLYLMNLDGSGLSELHLPSNLDTRNEIAFSPDGSRIIFSNSSGLYIVKSDGSDQIKIRDSTDQSYYYEFSFTYDGNNVIYKRGSHYYHFTDFRLYDISKMQDTSLFYDAYGSNGVRDYNVSKWNTLIFANANGINLVDLNKNYSHTFIHGGVNPQFSFDSTKITFMDPDFSSIYVMDLTQNSLKLINVDLPKNYIYHPILSVDAKRVFFQADTSWHIIHKVSSNNNIVY